MTDSEHANVDPNRGRADAAAEARGERPQTEAAPNEKPCSPAEAEANAAQAAERAS